MSAISRVGHPSAHPSLSASHSTPTINVPECLQRIASVALERLYSKKLTASQVSSFKCYVKVLTPSVGDYTKTQLTNGKMNDLIHDLFKSIASDFQSQNVPAMNLEVTVLAMSDVKELYVATVKGEIAFDQSGKMAVNTMETALKIQKGKELEYCNVLAKRLGQSQDSILDKDLNFIGISA